jgi:hypothetical protein
MWCVEKDRLETIIANWQKNVVNSSYTQAVSQDRIIPGNFGDSATSIGFVLETVGSCAALKIIISLS